jgi:tetratricopeptide (TPR) repeat protein
MALASLAVFTTSLAGTLATGPAGQYAQVANPLPASPSSPGAEGVASPEVRRLLDAADEAWPIRDGPGRMDDIFADLKRAEALAPHDYGVLWRIARWYYWMADAPGIPDAEKARLGKLAWEYGDNATQANPNRVEGWFYASTGVGMYSIGISIVKALLDGMEGKYLDRLKKAQSIDPAYYGYGAAVAWGRYYYELPWPKYDAEKSEEELRQALRQNPKNLRAKVFLAELYLKEDHAQEARKILEDVLAATPGAYDPPEERRVQAMARELLAKAKG